MAQEQYRIRVTGPISHDTRLQGHWLLLARGVWIALVLLMLVVFCMGIPQAYKLALSLRPETRAGLAHFGFSADFPAIYIITLDTMTILAFAFFAMLIFWRRSDDWMVLFVGLMLLFIAVLFTAPAFEANIPIELVALVAALAEISQVAFVYLFLMVVVFLAGHGYCCHPCLYGGQPCGHWSTCRASFL